MKCEALLLATVETKQEEIDYLAEALSHLGITARVIDISLGSGGAVWSPREKIAAMDHVVEHTIPLLQQATAEGNAVVVGLGGGTGGDIIMRVMHHLPMTSRKMLISPMPFDPRAEVADSSIILLPTLVDICGLNTILRQVLDNAAAMIAGLCDTEQLVDARTSSIAITALSTLSGATQSIACGLRALGHETTVFHANGFGGAAYARCTADGGFKAVVDVTTHELTRMLFIGSHTAMPTRFTAASDMDLPQVILPGGVNFLGFERLESVPPQYLERPHYQHSPLFTHVKLTADEMAHLAVVLATDLNHATGNIELIVPMGGFSSEDAPGGAIEDPALRQIFWQKVSETLKPHVRLTRLDSHISDPETAQVAIDALCDML